jgi:membrane-bound metal-dependent hydrolase YbcI (DUF457 family)
MFSSAAPDIDGIFLLAFWKRELFENLHHTFGHNLFYALLIGALTAIIAKRRRGKMFVLGVAMVLLHFMVDILTAADWGIPFFWPLSHAQYNIPIFLHVPASHLDTWDFALKTVVQWILKVIVTSGTVIIYIKYGRTFIELISSNLDLFLTDFAILPFRRKCDVPDCRNRAHYRCSDCDSVRCIRHCKINRNLTISCSDCARVH